MKSLSVKQAEKWLERLKNANPNSYKELSKELRRYDKRNDQYECFVKMNKTLLNHPDLTNQINNYLEEGNKFVVSMSEIDRINNLMKYIKKEKPQIYQQISVAIRNMTNDGDQDRQDNQVKDLVLNSVRGNQRLQAYADKVLNFTAEDFLNKLDLEHLKNNRQSQPQDDNGQEEIRKQPTKRPKTHIQPVIAQRVKEYIPPIKNIKWPFPPLTSPTQQKNFIRSLEKKLKAKDFQELTKIIHIYYLNIISKGEVIQFIKKIVGCQDDFQYISDILEARQTDRRRNSCFRPLSDFDYHKQERGTHSYVSMPNSYPTLCSTKIGLPKDILNNKWISIPRGSQDFNVRSKNQYEQNLLKAEDERYQFDLYIRRLKKAQSILNRINNFLNIDLNHDCTKLINTIISLGIVQLIYKNGNKDQKQELQWFLKRNTLEAAKLFSDRIKTQLIQLQDIKKIHGFKNWNQVAQKNWQKSQDFKGFAFKKSQKDKMKSNIFLNQLNIRLKYLECKGQLKALQTPFQDKKQFFSVFNSFESSSRIQKCISRKTAQPIVYDIRDYKIPTLLPVMIMSFQDQQACSTAYSFIIYYLQNSGVTETEKIRCRNFLRQIMSKFFKWNNFRYRTISSSFDEENFYGQFGPEQKKPVLPNLEEWITDEPDTQSQAFEKEDFKLPSFNYLQDQPSEYVYQPPKNKDNEIFFSSEHFYVFLRFLYALYQRIIRMREVADTKQKIKLFQLLYFTSIKTKESAKFEDCLTHLFSNHAHIFSTIYKLLESLAKSLNAVSLCNITNQSMKFIDIKCQQIYILLLNRYYLNNSISNSKILRFAFQLQNKLLYINSLQSYYKSDDQGKDLSKKRCQITRDIEYYTVQGITDQKDNEKSLLKNGFEYSFEGNTIKMLNLLKNEDLIANKKVGMKKKDIQGQIKKSYDFWKTQQ